MNESNDMSLPVHANDLLKCSTSAWYPNFTDATFDTAIINLPNDFVEWMMSDAIVVPDDSKAFPKRNNQEEFPAEDDYQEWSNSDDASEGDASTAALQAGQSPESYSEIVEEITTAIQNLGGAVAPKFTWSCPKDALWMTNNTLRCTNADEVLLLLRSSDRVTHDVSNALQDILSSGDSIHGGGIIKVSHSIALRKWYDLRPGREFRCFVIKGELVGISQRDLTQRFDFLPTEYSSIKARIQKFHTLRITGRFPLPSYTYDCYVPSSENASVKIIDFNPVGGTTAPLLFTWEELFIAEEKPSLANIGTTTDTSKASHDKYESSPSSSSTIDFRILTEEVPIRPAAAVYGVPFDFVDSSEGSALSRLMEEARKDQSQLFTA